MTDQTHPKDALRAREKARQTQQKTRRTRRRSRYERPPNSVSWTLLLFGVALGLMAGLYYAWIIQPISEAEVSPWQLETARDTSRLLPDQDAYIIAVLLAHDYEQNLAVTVQRLANLRLSVDDPFQYVADLACRLVRGGYMDSTSHRNAVRSMMRFYQQQGKTGCADQLILMDGRDLPTPTTIVLPTSTLIPPATKTPGPEETPVASGVVDVVPFVPTSAPARSFSLILLEPFCSEQIPGIIEVRVRDRFSGEEIPGLPVRVQGDDSVSSTFVTGMKPERGLGYADYRMEPGRTYVIDMPGYSEPSTREIRAQNCFDDNTGAPSVRSYRVVFAGN